MYVKAAGGWGEGLHLAVVGVWCVWLARTGVIFLCDFFFMNCFSYYFELTGSLSLDRLLHRWTLCDSPHRSVIQNIELPKYLPHMACNFLAMYSTRRATTSL